MTARNTTHIAPKLNASQVSTLTEAWSPHQHSTITTYNPGNCSGRCPTNMATLTSRPELPESGRCVHWRAWGPPIMWWQSALEAHTAAVSWRDSRCMSARKITLLPGVQEGYHILSSYVQNISASRRRPHLSCVLRMVPGPCQASGHARELSGRPPSHGSNLYHRACWWSYSMDGYTHQLPCSRPARAGSVLFLAETQPWLTWFWRSWIWTTSFWLSAGLTLPVLQLDHMTLSSSCKIMCKYTVTQTMT